jgi:hypothetical protein
MGSYRLQYAQPCVFLTAVVVKRRDCSKGIHAYRQFLPQLISVDRGISAGTDVLMSSKASNVSWEDSAMDIMDEEACRRSRYRSLRFHIRVPKKYVVDYTGTHPTLSRSSTCQTSASYRTRLKSQCEINHQAVRRWGYRDFEMVLGMTRFVMASGEVGVWELDKETVVGLV